MDARSDVDRDTRERILDAASREFSASGFDGARTQAIADTAGVNKAMIYYHFEDKRHLYEEVLAHNLSQVLGEVVTAAIGADLRARDRIGGLLSGFSRFLSENPHMRSLMLREVASGAGTLRRVAAGLREKVPGMDPRRMLTGVEEMMERGEIRQGDPAQVLLHLISLAVFPHIARPLLEILLGMDSTQIHRFFEARPAAIDVLLARGLLIQEVS